MTMPRGASRALYAGNGQAAEFPFFFKVFEEDQLSVLLTSPAGVTSEAEGWTAELDEGGGTVRYLHNGAPLPEGWKLAIVRDMPFVQEVDLITGTRFDPEVIETALDVATAERQQLLERLARAVVVEPTDEAGPEALLADIREARASAVTSAGSAQANANAAGNSAQSAAGSAAIAAEQRETACVCAQEARAARDVAIAQAEAANTLMEAELAKVNAIVAANRTDQEAAVTAAQAWAEKEADVPVAYDEEGNALYSARHWAENAQKIAIEPPTAERRGAVRVGAGLHLETGENGETDLLTADIVQPDGVTTSVDDDGLLSVLGGNLLLNSEAWITESGEWEAPVDGGYSLVLFGGGNSGHATLNTSAQCRVFGGASGAIRHIFMYLKKGQKIPVVIGAGGPSPANAGGTNYGGATSFGDVTTADDSSVYFSPFAAIATTLSSAVTRGLLAYGQGLRGGAGATPVDGASQAANNARCDATGHWGGGGGACVSYHGTYAAGAGAQGSVWVRWHDPDKAAGPVPTPALLSARRMAPRAAAAPATVNLYDPETGQGSVWREEDAEAPLAPLAGGLITEAAWLEILAARAAEEREAWLASPDTEAERFELLRAAREATLAEYDRAVAELRRKERAGADVTAALAAWDAYAEALCDLPAQEGAPWDGGGDATPWPELPPAQAAWEGDASCA